MINYKQLDDRIDQQIQNALDQVTFAFTKPRLVIGLKGEKKLLINLTLTFPSDHLSRTGFAATTTKLIPLQLPLPQLQVKKV